jgi:hypothetical protein
MYALLGQRVFKAKCGPFSRTKALQIAVRFSRDSPSEFYALLASLCARARGHCDEPDHQQDDAQRNGQQSELARDEKVVQQATEVNAEEWARMGIALVELAAERIGNRVLQKVVTVLQITDIDANKDDAWSAIELYGRLPEDERYDDGVIIDLIRRHLSGDFGPRRPAAYWKAFFLIAKLGTRVVGMLLGYNYNDGEINFVYIPYLVVSRPQPAGDNPRDVSQALIDALVRLQQGSTEDGRFRFVAEVDDPRETDDASEQLERRARIRLFDRIAGFARLNLRCLDYKFIQPRLEPWSDLPEKRLLILYGSQDPLPVAISKAELLQVITWFYKQLYAANISDDPNEDRQYQCYLDKILERVTEALPDSVHLLRLQQIYRETNRCLVKKV